jgi:OmpA-OmpF porin, OOP family
MTNTKTISGITMILALMAGVSVAQAADESVGGWYAGIGVGRGDAKRTGSWAEQADLGLLAKGTTSLTTIGGGDTGWKFYVGNQFHENIAVEAGYTRLGKFGGSSVVTAPAAGVATGTWDAYAANVSAVGLIPLGNQFTAFGKLGIAYSRLSASVVAPGPVVFSPSASRFEPLIGLGVRYDFNKRIGLRAEWEHFNNVGDGSTTGQTAVEVWSLNAQFRF